MLARPERDRPRQQTLERLWRERTAGGGASNAPAAALGGMAGDRARARRRAARKQTQELRLHPLLQRDVLCGTSLGVALAPALPSRLVGQTVALGPLERVCFDQHSSALVAPASAAEAHHDRRQAARCPRAARERRIPRPEEHEVVHLRTRQARGSAVVHDQQPALRSAADRAGELPERLDHDQIWPPSRAPRDSRALRLGEVGRDPVRLEGAMPRRPTPSPDAAAVRDGGTRRVCRVAGRDRIAWIDALNDRHRDGAGKVDGDATGVGGCCPGSSPESSS